MAPVAHNLVWSQPKTRRLSQEIKKVPVKPLEKATSLKLERAASLKLEKAVEKEVDQMVAESAPRAAAYNSRLARARAQTRPTTGC